VLPSHFDSSVGDAIDSAALAARSVSKSAGFGMEVASRGGVTVIVDNRICSIRPLRLLTSVAQTTENDYYSGISHGYGPEGHE
jgi:hypothetical protein